MGVDSIASSRHGGLGLKLGAASVAHPAADYWELSDTDIPNPQACINEGKALVLNGTADTYKCTGGGVDYSLYIIPRNG